MSETVWKIVSGLIVASAIPIWRKVILPAIKRRKLKKEQRRELEERILAMPEKQDQILKQLYPNGGSSLFDIVNQLNQNYLSLQEQLYDMEIEQKIRLGIQKVSFGKSNALGEFTYVSPIMCKIFDREPRDLLRYGWKSFISRPDFERIEVAWESHIEESRLFDESFNIVDSEGKILSIRCTAYPVPDKLTGKYKGSYITVIKNSDLSH